MKPKQSDAPAIADLRAAHVISPRPRPQSYNDECIFPPERTCDTCGWSWFRDYANCLLCLNLDSPHCYDSVPPDLNCQQHEAETE